MVYFSLVNAKLSLIIIASLFAATQGMLCSIIPCPFLQAPHPFAAKQFYSKPSGIPAVFPQYPGSAYVYPSRYQYQLPLPIFVILVNRPVDQTVPNSAADKQSETNPQAAVQVLSPPSTGSIDATITSTTESHSDVVTKPSDTNTKPSAPTSIPSYSPVTLPNVDSTNSPPVSTSVKADGGGESKQLDTTTGGGVSPLDTSGHRALLWREKWLQPVNTSQPKLCQANESNDIPDEVHHQCLTTCEDVYNSKLDSIGLTRTGVIFLGGSCEQDVCKCFVRLGMQYDTFSITNHDSR